MATRMQLMSTKICLCLTMVLLLMFDNTQSKVYATKPVNNQVLRKGNCSTVRSSSLIKEAYRGWPYSLEWKELDLEFRASFPSAYDYNYDYSMKPTIVNYTILDLDTNNIISNASYELETSYSAYYRFPDMGENSSLNFEITLSTPSSNACLAALVHINLTDLPQHTCEEAVRLSRKSSRSQHVGEFSEFSCSVPHSMTPKLTLGDHTTHKWLKDCSVLPAYTKPYRNNRLHITNVTYEHPGVYTCAVTHNKQTWYTVHHDLCVRPRRIFHRHSIKCSMETVYAEVGDKAVAVCTGYLSNGHSHSIGLDINWKKKPTYDANLTRCDNPITASKAESFSKTNPNVKCDYEMDKLPCFEKTPSKEERKLKSQTIKMKLEITNLKESDFGEYEVTLSSLTWKPIKATVEIKRSEERALITLAIGIGISFGILFILLIFAIVSYTTYKRRKNSTLRQVKRSKSTDDTSTITESI